MSKRARKDGPADVGMIGLAVMGSNLARNMADHGYRVAVYNRDPTATDRFLAEDAPTPGSYVGCPTYERLVGAIRRPRRIVMLIKAGAPVDQVLDALEPLLDEDDVVVDGGNSLWTDTIRRDRRLAARRMHFVGSGVSGGEEGARFGPSLMPGGSRKSWTVIRRIWNDIAAKVDERTGKPIEGAAPGRPVRGGVPCTTWIGTDGAGHYVKMVHNGIEYADLQLIGEAYFLLRELFGLGPERLADVFARWNRGDLDSYLIEISADILRQPDPAGKQAYLVDAVLDTAGQKGTGRWTSRDALELGVPAPTIAEAVFARTLSALRDERVAASKVLRGPDRRRTRRADREWIDAVRDALYCAKVCAYAQGFALMAAAAREYSWKLDFAAIARIWRGGCIIRARFLDKIAAAWDEDPALANLLLARYFRGKLRAGQRNWRRVVALAAEAGVPCPAFMSALAYYDGYRTARLPANLLQAQRDYFGAHTFERVDEPRGRFFHVDWPSPDRPQEPR